MGDSDRDEQSGRYEGSEWRDDVSLRERMARVETTQSHLAATQESIAESQDEILQGVNEIREEMPAAERVDEIEELAEYNGRYVAILKWAGSALGLLTGGSMLVWVLQVVV